jgi:hypothetical protein
MNDEDIKQIIQNSVDENPAGVHDTVTSMLNRRAMDFLNTQRETVAKDYFGGKVSGSTDDD